MATLIGHERLVVGWGLGYDLASLGLGDTRVMRIDLASDPVVRNFLQEVLQTQSGVPQDVGDFIMN